MISLTCVFVLVGVLFCGLVSKSNQVFELQEGSLYICAAKLFFIQVLV